MVSPMVFYGSRCVNRSCWSSPVAGQRLSWGNAARNCIPVVRLLPEEVYRQIIDSVANGSQWIILWFTKHHKFSGSLISLDTVRPLIFYEIPTILHEIPWYSPEFTWNANDFTCNPPIFYAIPMILHEDPPISLRFTWYPPFSMWIPMIFYGFTKVWLRFA